MDVANQVAARHGAISTVAHDLTFTLEANNCLRVHLHFKWLQNMLNASGVHPYSTSEMVNLWHDVVVPFDIPQWTRRLAISSIPVQQLLTLLQRCLVITDDFVERALVRAEQVRFSSPMLAERLLRACHGRVELFEAAVKCTDLRPKGAIVVSWSLLS